MQILVGFFWGGGSWDSGVREVGDDGFGERRSGIFDGDVGC